MSSSSTTPADLLFSGDHVLPHITPSIGFQPAPAELPLNDFIDSLRLVRGMPDRRMLPAHGPVSESVHTRVDELLEHHRQRLETMGTQIAAGASTAFEAAHRLGWTRRNRKLSEMDSFNQMLAVLETAAHLDLLVSQGKLAAQAVDGVRHYTMPDGRFNTAGSRLVAVTPLGRLPAYWAKWMSSDVPVQRTSRRSCACSAHRVSRWQPHSGSS